MEETITDAGTVTFDWCADCAAVVRSDDPCEHADLEFMGLVEW